MIVARQFIAWYTCENGNRPVGHGMIGSDRCAKTRTISQLRGKDQAVPYGTDLVMDIFQAINCLVALTQSLRDRFLGI